VPRRAVKYDHRTRRAAGVARIVCDLGLPGGVDGYAVARACRREPTLQKTRASGYSRPEDHAKAKEAGFDRLVLKPITFATLDALLREMAPVS
jgi:CheY-like chemotaxis protein